MRRAGHFANLDDLDMELVTASVALYRNKVGVAGGKNRLLPQVTIWIAIGCVGFTPNCVSKSLGYHMIGFAFELFALRHG